MADPVFHSDRFFQAWRYTVSHRQLLLRSTKSDVAQTRIDIVFKDVSLMLIGPTFRGMTIPTCDSSILKRSGLPTFDLGGRSLYQIQTQSHLGFVAAGNIMMHEDELGFEAPSALLIGSFL